MTDFTQLFQKVKHSEYQISKKEALALKTFLGRKAALFDFSTHAAIYVFVLSNLPTEENVKLVERFLCTDAEDYVRQSAITCLTRHWKIKQKYDKLIAEEILCPDTEETGLTKIAAIDAALEAIFRDHNKFLEMVIRKKIDFYLDKGKAKLNDEEVENVIHLGQTAKLLHSTVNKGKVDFFRLSIDDALDVIDQFDDLKQT